eukprot:TRINITY_DN273_c0_g1_i1.p1 TRINITY_DN273_c0_g1~~TRINITY_DN273_c0_g1_i1.p1  ORF type:complete len:261 (+),score=67.69 TRINITY_DN273_c0_g1_i1:81-863(+)
MSEDTLQIPTVPVAAGGKLAAAATNNANNLKKQASMALFSLSSVSSRNLGGQHVRGVSLLDGKSANDGYYTNELLAVNVAGVLEILRTLKSAGDVTTDLLMWKRPFYSMLVSVITLWLILHPSYILIVAPLLMSGTIWLRCFIIQTSDKLPVFNGMASSEAREARLQADAEKLTQVLKEFADAIAQDRKKKLEECKTQGDVAKVEAVDRERKSFLRKVQLWSGKACVWNENVLCFLNEPKDASRLLLACSFIGFCWSFFF